MQEFVLSVTWAATAIVFVAVSLVLAMVSGATAMWTVIRLYYLVKVEQERMQENADAEIRVLTGKGLEMTESDIDRLTR